MLKSLFITAGLFLAIPSFASTLQQSEEARISEINFSTPKVVNGSILINLSGRVATGLMDPTNIVASLVNYEIRTGKDGLKEYLLRLNLQATKEGTTNKITFWDGASSLQAWGLDFSTQLEIQMSEPDVAKRYLVEITQETGIAHFSLKYDGEKVVLE